MPVAVGALGQPPNAWKITKGIGNQRKNRDHPNIRIVEISWTTEKRPKETCCRSDFSEIQLAKAGVKNLKK